MSVKIKLYKLFFQRKENTKLFKNKQQKETM